MTLNNKYLFAVVALIVIMSGFAFVNSKIKKSEIHSQLISETEDKTQSTIHYEGDIVFQNTTSTFSNRIKKITHCKWDQVGILFSRNSEWYVYEVDEEVQYTKFTEWVDKGNEGKYVVKRLKNVDKVLTDEVMVKMKGLADDFFHRNNDIFYSNDDLRLYNSELVYKMYLRSAGIALGKMIPLKTCDLSDPEVQKLIKVKYGGDVPMDSLIVSPQAIFDSDQLMTVYSDD